MKLVYSPEGADPREWDVKVGRLPVDDTIDIETKTGMLFRDWSGALLGGGAKAMKALLWVMLRRDNATLRYEQVQFSMDEVDFDFDDEELKAYVDSFDAQIAEDGLELPPSALRELERLRALAYPAEATGAAEEPAEDAGPKASRSKTSSADTSSTSPST